MNSKPKRPLSVTPVQCTELHIVLLFGLQLRVQWEDWANVILLFGLLSDGRMANIYDQLLIWAKNDGTLLNSHLKKRKKKKKKKKIGTLLNSHFKKSKNKNKNKKLKPMMWLYDHQDINNIFFCKWDSNINILFKTRNVNN